jgi:hypothetical protein
MIENPPLYTVTFISDEAGAAICHDQSGATNISQSNDRGGCPPSDFVETYLVLFQVNVGRFLSYRRLHMDVIQPSWIALVCYYHILPNPQNLPTLQYFITSEK